MKAQKERARAQALAARAGATAAMHTAASAQLVRVLHDVLAPYRGAPLAGYSPMRGEADPIAAMTEAAARGPVAMPVIQARATPLRFRAWTPGCAMVPGPFGAAVPAAGPWVTPQVVIVPLVGFDARGGRLGYGGGYYDRTLAALRAQGPVVALGYGLAVQQLDDLPLEPTDQPLDMMVTDQGALTLG